MARYRIGNDMTVVWSIYDHTGAAYNLKGKEVRLYYTCERGRFEVDFEVQGTNIVVWSFFGREQKVIGDYTLSLEIIESADRRRIFKDYCNAFTLVGKSCEEAALGNPNISEDGNIVLSSKLDVYKIQPIIPTVGSNSNWFVDGTDTGKPSTGKSAYEYAKEKGYEGTESEYAESLKLAPENAEKLTELSDKIISLIPFDGIENGKFYDMSNNITIGSTFNGTTGYSAVFSRAKVNVSKGDVYLITTYANTNSAKAYCVVDKNNIVVQIETDAVTNKNLVIEQDGILYVNSWKDGKPAMTLSKKDYVWSDTIKPFAFIGSLTLQKPNFTNSTLDFGEDPAVLCRGKIYQLKNLDTSASYRNVSLHDIEGTGTSAVQLLFNVTTNKFYCKRFDSSLSDNEVLIGGIRKFDNFVVANVPFVYTYNGKELWEPAANANNKKINVSLIAGSATDKPNVFKLNSKWYLDLGYDPAVVVGTTTYPMRIKHSDSSLYRKISLSDVENTGTSAVKLVFNLETATLYCRAYHATLDANETLVGGIRLGDEPLFNLPFSFTIEGQELWSADSKKQNGRMLKSRTFLSFIAHRGVHINGIPENSIDAYRYAGRCGFRYVETDFQVTSDGELVLMHNESINDTMRNASDYSAISSTIKVGEHTLSDLRNKYVLISSDERMRKPIPTLEEFLETCLECNLFPFLEIKSFGMERQYIDKAYVMAKNILGDGNFAFLSFNSEYVDYVRTLSDQVHIGYITQDDIAETINTITGEKRAAKNTWWLPTWDIQNYGGSALTKERIRQHRLQGVNVAVWTTPVSKFDELLKLGVNCLSADFICPSIDGIIGKVATSDSNWDEFSHNGSVSNKVLHLSAGQSCSVEAGQIWLGGYYLSIIGKGNFMITAPNLNATINNTTTDRYIYQGLINNTMGKFTITANSATDLEFIEFSCVQY